MTALERILKQVQENKRNRFEINEGKMIPRKFNSSVEADEYMDTLSEMINAPVIAQYARETDKNYSTKMAKELEVLKKAMKKFMDEYMSAG